MSSLRSRLKGIIRISNPSSQTVSDKEAAVPGLDLSKPSPSRTKSKKDDLGFLELVSGTDPIVDIIAVHGLDGHREKTWTAENGILWLRDLLSIDIPNARILAYGYDADTRSRECVSTQTIYQHADKFLKSLSRQRCDHPRRPIIFIAHSLGGIVLKQALGLCHSESVGSKNDARDILVSTHAVLFFGTPHFGVKGAELLQTMNRLLSVYLKTTKIIVRNLKENSSALENIQRLYMSASKEIETVLFYEVYPTPIIGGKSQMIVPYNSATVAGDRQAIEEGLDADHCEMVKFPDSGHANYATVLSYVKQYVEGATTGVTKKWCTEDAYRDLANREDVSPNDIVLPKPRLAVSRNYVNRPRIQSLITQNLLPSCPVQKQPRCILHGIGGAGKTQLAAKWIRDNETRFTSVIFVDASSQTQLEKDLELSVQCLGPEYSEMTWKEAVAYLDRKAKGWLLFFDNADSPDLDLSPYLPVSTHGAVLITARNGECVDYAPDGAVLVGDLEENEAIELLHRVANVTPQDDAESVKIVRELGMLALAITQAGAYIRKTRRLDTYLDTFRKHRDRLMRKKPGLGSEYTSSTYTAFDLSFDCLPTQAQELLKLCAFLHHSAIPIFLFEESTKNGFTTYPVLNGCPPPESDKALMSNLEEILGSAWDALEFQEIVESAYRASFIDVSNDGLVYGVHPLLQVYIKDRLNADENRFYSQMTAKLLLGAIRPAKGSNAHLWPLLPHAAIIPLSMKLEHVAYALAFYTLYESLGDWNACRELLAAILSQLRQDNGERHGNSLWVMSALAIALNRCGRLDEAEKIKREVLALELEILGRRHPDTISAMNNLASTLSDRGQWVEAERIQREVLALRLEILGGRHPHTIWAMGNLASTLSDRGQYVEAEKIKREVLALRLEILGGRHPHTISAMKDVANILHDCCQFEAAENLQREALNLRLEILGGRHPDTISAMSNLAATSYRRGLLEDAEKLQRKAVALRLEILGREHPRSLDACYNLALMLYEGNQFDEATKLLQETMALRVVIFGADHTHTRRPQQLLNDLVSGQPPRLQTHTFLLS